MARPKGHRRGDCRWLAATGDIGQLDDEGYLEITDRKKDIIVNAGGDNIAPAKVEERLTFEPEIARDGGR